MSNAAVSWAKKNLTLTEATRRGTQADDFKPSAADIDMTPEDRLKQIHAYISRMPSLSTTMCKVIEICSTQNTSANELNRVISYDPVLTGQVLNLMNSAFYNLPGRITSLTRAIIMLGVNTVKNLALATSVLASFKNDNSDTCISMDDFWEHCLCVGTTARAIAKIKGVPVIEQEEYFMAGLLHDLGKLPMIACFNDLYQKAVRTSQSEHISLYSAENMHIGFNHSQVGLLIGTKWHLDSEMQQAIAYHHTPLDGKCKPSQLLFCTSLADQIAECHRIGYAVEPNGHEPLIQALVDRLSVKKDTLFNIKPMVEQEMAKAKIFMDKN